MNKILELHAEWLKKQGLVQKAKMFRTIKKLQTK